MASDKDEENEHLIENFRPRLRVCIDAERVLDYLHFIETDEKERISQKARTDCNSGAVDALINAVVKTPHTLGWFRAFVDALVQSGCERAADYMQINLPEPEVEAENDSCVRLIELLSPTLVDMQTEEVCVHCLSEELLTDDDSEIVSTFKPTADGFTINVSCKLSTHVVCVCFQFSSQ